ncbi:(2Fe-2S) ferredoxin domain-containing protein [Streptomyces halobius]|uniref:(2Fe-2S) ferredoxin domain-containing protein n=1 Tax=Streptomyces halobius TaxID=2879846 RepID=A0ABY4LZB0_9ACTN|nr:(2Fe-2S) ferredoxin domain-containing protein [Streptomyces halobius]UQA90810.1 (2Fe-2S) ferredoxin domain-containing protein [Streptomyces halobius]
MTGPGSRTRIGAARGRPCTLVVCRGCCCGSPRKHPGTDHAWQLARLRAAAAESGGRLAVRTSECLGPCSQANIIVVQPSGEGRRRGGRAVWIAWVLEDDSTDAVLTWVTAGGPGIAPPPPSLELRFVPSPGEAQSRTRARARRARR